jgi:ferredoxin-type protein NapH
MTENIQSAPSSRQKIRKALLLISILLIPVTIFYVSPIVIMMGAAEGIVSGSMLLFIVIFILSLGVARLWCGWLCPMGAWQEICSPVITSLQVLMIVGFIFAIIFIVAYFTGRRGFCHVFCPIAGLMVAGRKIRNIFRWPSLQLGADASRCTDCKTCSKECPMGLDVNGMVRQGKMENADCILCARCADTCPEGVIRYSLAGK